MTRLATVVCITLAIAGAAYWGRDRLAVRATPPESPRFAVADTRTMSASVIATGIVRLRVGAEVRVGSQVSGIVQRLNVTVGSRIRQGDVIAEIDSRALEAQLAQARAQVAVAAEDVKQTEVQLARARQLGERQLVPRQQVEDLALAVDSAKAKLTKAERDADAVSTTLSYAVIRAPISGTVASVATQEGETVAAAFAAPTFVTIIGDHALQLIAMVDETDIGAVTPRNLATFNVEAYTGRDFTGHVERVAPKATIVSGVVNYEVMIAIDSPADALKPDMTANVSIRTAEREALVIPNVAVQREGGERFVFIDDHGTRVKRSVTVGPRNGIVIEVTKGLNAGDRVLLSGVANVTSQEASR
ncbi:MAG TPA: efflux RND transporter periplasmic adaptor subunit [Vicinamibacterales bacterium]|jgi:macrolide-specific efflux system membrane fusion protein